MSTVLSVSLSLQDHPHSLQTCQFSEDNHPSNADVFIAIFTMCPDELLQRSVCGQLVSCQAISDAKTDCTPSKKKTFPPTVGYRAVLSCSRRPCSTLLDKPDVSATNVLRHTRRMFVELQHKGCTKILSAFIALPGASAVMYAC